MITVFKLFVIAVSCINLEALSNNRYYPYYHLAPPNGWMNDPNGFCVFKNEYHLFYQFNPISSQEPGIAHWGHAKSTDLFHWVHLPIAMSPDETYDKDGVFSGSAVVDSGTMYLFYTGNVNLPNETPNHKQVQALASSTDGVTVTKYPSNPVIAGADRQPDFRDPKVWKHGSNWYMVLGNSFVKNGETLGRALLYKSSDKLNWEEVSVLHESDGSLGFMYECPDFFELNGRFVLLFSPQGIKPQGDRFKNLYQTGYIVGHFDYTYNLFTPLSEFRELDFGHDFYATQTILDNLGRRLLVAWMDMWEQNYPERDDGFTGQMTLVRTLSLTNDHKLVQKPVTEIVSARGRAIFMGNAWGGKRVYLSGRTCEIFIIAPRNRDLILEVESENTVVTVTYNFKDGTVSLDRGGDDGLRRTVYRPQTKLKLKAFVDASSIELFFGDGEVTFSSRFFPTAFIRVHLKGETVAEILSVHEMKRTVPYPGESD